MNSLEKPLVFATGNENKLHEAKELIPSFYTEKG
jgi:inosine/xanthosine triphosphate pyrophosphatase family protein